jgi:hypothetical protein
MRDGTMQNKVEVTEQQNCIHHWIIDSPNDDTSYGKCKRCGTVAEFSNTFSIDFVNHVGRPEKTPIQPID